jgi:hypothetical protein
MLPPSPRKSPRWAKRHGARIRKASPAIPPLPLIAAHGDPGSDAVRGPMRPTPQLEQCPYLRQVLSTFGAVLGRTRLMRLQGQGEVTAHVDIDYYWREHVRIHVPIQTQPEVTFYCAEQSTHMAAGDCWIFDNLACPPRCELSRTPARASRRRHRRRTRLLGAARRRPRTRHGATGLAGAAYSAEPTGATGAAL